MKENVGRSDQIVRSVIGPAVLAAGYFGLHGKQGRTAGLAAMIGGVLIIESAITRTCPLNELIGIDTTGRTNAKVTGRLRRIRT